VTLRYNAIEPDALDEAVRWLASRGAHPYAVLEDWEAAVFRERFALDSAPAGEGLREPGHDDGLFAFEVGQLVRLAVSRLQTEIRSRIPNLQLRCRGLTPAEDSRD